MGQTVSFDYFYGGQSDTFSYYRIPRLLITGQQFKGLSTDAKLLYGLMLDRMGLSARNGWYDELGRVYIYYPLDEVQADLMLAARSRKQEAIRSKPLNTRGKSLLAGNIFCGHCGARLCITTSGKGRRRQDGTDVVRMRYTCQTKSRTHGECDGQTGYTVEKLDAMIDSIIRGIFSRVRSLNRKDVVNACVDNDLNAKKVFLRKVQKDYEKAEKDLQRLKSEIVNALTGASAFSPELLNNVIEEQSQRCEELRAALNKAEKEYAESDSQLEVRSQQYDDLLEWSAAYETASVSAKKVIVARMIERVDVYRGYQLKLKLNISVEQFLVSLENIKTPEQSFTA